MAGSEPIIQSRTLVNLFAAVKLDSSRRFVVGVRPDLETNAETGKVFDFLQLNRVGTS